MQAISDSLDAHMRELARRDAPRWRGLSRDQRLREAAAAAMADIAQRAQLAQFRAGLQAMRAAETDARTAAQQGPKVTRSQAYIRDLVNTDDYAHGVRNEAFATLRDLFEAAGSRDGTGLLRNLGMRIFDLDNPKMTADVVREVFANANGHTGNAAAKAGAQAWLDTIEGLRTRFNAAGGDIGKLGYGYLSQAHDSARVAATSADDWARATLPLLDRTQYLDADGRLLDNAEMIDLLKAAHETISTDGANKTAPGAFRGPGARANRGADHRVLHFKDGDAWMAYMGQFGEGSLYDSMMGHVSRMARDVALVERMGPNPAATHLVQADIARRADAPRGKTLGEKIANTSVGNDADAYWTLVSGATGTPENRFIARLGSDLRNIQTAAKITWGPFSALADVGTILQTLHYDKVPYFDYVKAYGRQFDKAHREALRSHGVIAESLASSLNRWTGDHMTHGLTGHVTNGVMKLSLMNAWTDAARNAFADVMMVNWAKKVGTDWGKLTEWDRHLMQRKGITEDDWNVITQATPASTRVPLLSGPAIRATGLPGAAEAATKWTAFVTDESQFAVVNPDLATRAIVTSGGQPAGTIRGEVARSVAQFKSFPMAMLTRHWRRVLETPQGLEGAPLGYGADSAAGATVNRIATLAALGLTTTLLGAIQTQSRQVLSGKDPIDMAGEHAGAFWAKAFAAGGGAGFLADVLLAPVDSPMYGWGAKFGVLGPVAGAAGGVIDIATSQHPGETAVRWASDQLPGVDMWQTRALYEHWFLHNAQEWLNPGYLSRMEQRARRDWGQDFWWTPGEFAPARAPDFGAALGQ